MVLLKQFPNEQKNTRRNVLLFIEIILDDKILWPIFNSLCPMQSKPIDLVPSNDERKEDTNVELIRGISKETSVTFE